MSSPVGFPCLSRWISPPGGSGVSLVYPTARRAAPFNQARSYRCRTNTGVSGAAALISSRVGMRRSANWNSVQPPITRTHWGGGVRARLLLQHAQRVRQRRHAVPAQLHVVVEPAADRMHVRIVEAGDDPPPLQVDPLCRLIAAVSRSSSPPVADNPCPPADGNGRDLGMGRIEGGDGSVVQNQFRCIHVLTPL